jgi:hypothetical protein
MSALVNPIADRILELLKDDPELRYTDREALRSALLPLAHRCK